MGTNSKTTHHAYVTAPTALAQDPASPATAPDGADLAPSAAVITAFSPAATGAGPLGPGGPGPAAAPLADLLDLPAQGPPPDPWADAITPLPETLPVGQAFGTPAMVGGLDLADSAVTVMSYADGESSREVLTATVTPEAEAQLLDALSLSGTKMVPVETVTTVDERLAADLEAKLAEKIATAAKGANHDMKHGNPIDLTATAAANQALSAVKTKAEALAATDPQAAEDLNKMIAHYGTTIDAIYARADGAVNLPYTQGGKIPQTTAYTQPTEKTVTTYQPAPTDPGELEPGTLLATARTTSRIAATIDTTTGAISWNGTKRQDVSGTEYSVDLGDGYQAVYRPHQTDGVPDAKRAPFSMRGQLEIIAPAGAGHERELVARLGQLNLGNTPASAADAEWAYLKANVTAQNLGKNSQVAAAMAAAAHLDEMHVQELFHTEGHRAVGLDADGLHTLAREFQTRAAATALPAKVSLLRDAVAGATGHASGHALAGSPGYQPTPTANAGWLSWSRFDVTGDGGEVAAAWKGKALVHNVTGSNVAEMLRTGAFASTERRRAMGLQGHGLSEGQDMNSGGANSVFLRVKSAPVSGGMQLVWDDPVRLMAKADLYGYNSDKFGVVNPEHASTHGMTRDPKKIAGFTHSSNEVMIGNGLDLLGHDAPTRILTGNAAQRSAVLKVLADKGVTYLGGKPVADVVTI